jgi:hypothetical protein
MGESKEHGIWLFSIWGSETSDLSELKVPRMAKGQKID